jgi:hypothetical protein
VIRDGTRFGHSETAIWDDIDGVLTLCNTETVEFFRLNEAGTLIWKACGETSPLGRIVEALAAVYSDEPAEKLEQEATVFLLALMDAGLLTSS